MGGDDGVLQSGACGDGDFQLGGRRTIFGFSQDALLADAHVDGDVVFRSQNGHEPHQHSEGQQDAEDAKQILFHMLSSLILS